MMDRISIGWVWLDRTLNAIIDELNKQKPLPSMSIAVEEAPNGSLLKVIPVQQGGKSAQGGTGGKPVVWNGVGWVTVTIVDPVTCAQFSLSVLAQIPNSSITIQK